MNKKLRLIVTRKCHLNCEGCCNKQPQFSKVDKIEEDDILGWDALRELDELIITGGEPMLYPEVLRDFIEEIREWYHYNNDLRIYVYTAKPTFDTFALLLMPYFIDGITLTLHNKESVTEFFSLYEHLKHSKYLDDITKSVRLHVFKEATKLFKLYLADNILPIHWNIKTDIEWIPDCPLPKGEKLKELSPLFEEDR